MSSRLVSSCRLALVPLTLIALSPAAAPAQTCVDPPPNIASWWPGDGNSLDIVGTHHGSQVNGALSGEGFVGAGFVLDGVDDYIDFGDPVIDGWAALTIEGWVRRGATTTQQTIAGIHLYQALGPGSNTNDTGLYYSNDQIRFSVSTDPSGRQVVSSETNGLAEGEWTHLAGTYDGTTSKLYKNGELVSQADHSGTIAATLPFRIGYEHSNEELFFDGFVDELTLYDRALDPVEIQAIFEAGSAGKCKPDCVLTPVDPTWTDSFDRYVCGSTISHQGDWETWDLTGTDANVACDPEPVLSGNSLWLSDFDNVVRVICDTDAADTPHINVTANCYVPSSMTGEGYFTLLNSYEHGGAKNWAMQLQMNNDLSAITNLGGSDGGAPGGTSVSLPVDEWFDIRVEIDLETNTHSIFITSATFGKEILELDQIWSGGTGSTIELQCINLLSDGAANPGFYYEDVSVEVLATGGSDMLRGDCDGDGGLNGLLDALKVLEFGFFPGALPPPCLAQCDADSDQAFNALLEALYILNFQFVGGSPIGDPFPNCGTEPPGVDSIGQIGCEIPTCP